MEKLRIVIKILKTTIEARQLKNLYKILSLIKKEQLHLPLAALITIL